MWAGPLYNPYFIQKILDMLPAMDRETYQTIDRVEGLLTTALEEDLDKKTTPQQLSAIIPRANPALQDRHPFFFNLNAIAQVLHTQPIPCSMFRDTLGRIGYQSTHSHTNPNSIRTEAPWNIVWDVMREWVRQKCPIKAGALRAGSAGAAIMRRSRDDNSPLSLLQRDIGEALKDGQDLRDLTTRIEAALYRSSSRVPTSNSSNEGPEVDETRKDALNIVFDEALG